MAMWAFWASIFIIMIVLADPGLVIELIWEYGGYILVFVGIFFLFGLFHVMGMAQRGSEIFRLRPSSPKIRPPSSIPKERLDPPPIRG
jgi:hypothetical protein